MSRLSERSVMHIFIVTMMVIIMTSMITIIATDESSPLSPSSSATSISFNEIKNKELQGKAGIEEYEKPNYFVEDYGVWNPTPRSGGAYASPVPHAA
ncbi:hypothetical protein ERO13_A06G006150v2 [Gossypium hirsutum]|uniref:Transmembrane protein n=2 Tax=Gossypium TaxID=3633 RepID=A0A5D2YQY0_GOSMU|nr:hypothetical protein ERO13_A06G006150v2 [Gossypium hirsutum]KAG4193683.1 hypothetical protein ERO13_A06G006150v2 [Gossypium hirsutum]TYI20995.1 hypothetical protein ES332_A06G006800v1 [Gossypium tomentosum]TYJ28533.1 hypothetical protein E1A91_A06G006300v1 [Gossypium mustelinum]